jgi:hypothetical protein
MSKHASYTLDGWIAEDFDKYLDGPNGIDRVLQDTGAYGVKAMRDVTHDSDASGRLSASIMYITNKGLSSNIRKPAVKSEDTIEPPTEEQTLLVGSGAVHAIYREKYSGTHKHWEGHEKFEESMKEWCKKVLGIDPDRSPGEAFDFAMILKHIRDTVTEGHPFVLPNVERITKYSLKQLKKSLKKFLNSKAHKEG